MTTVAGCKFIDLIELSDIPEESQIVRYAANDDPIFVLSGRLKNTETLVSLKLEWRSGQSGYKVKGGKVKPKTNWFGVEDVEFFLYENVFPQLLYYRKITPHVVYPYKCYTCDNYIANMVNILQNSQLPQYSGYIDALVDYLVNLVKYFDNVELAKQDASADVIQVRKLLFQNAVDVLSSISVRLFALEQQIHSDDLKTLPFPVLMIVYFCHR